MVSSSTSRINGYRQTIEISEAQKLKIEVNEWNFILVDRFVRLEQWHQVVAQLQH